MDELTDGTNTVEIENYLLDDDSGDTSATNEKGRMRHGMYRLGRRFTDVDNLWTKVLFVDPVIDLPDVPFFITAIDQFIQTRKWRCVLTLMAKQIKNYPYHLEGLTDWERRLPESPTKETLGEKKLEIEKGIRFPLNLINNYYSPMLATIEERTGEYSYIVELLHADNLSEEAQIKKGSHLGISTMDIKWNPYATKTNHYDFAIIDSVLSSETV